jgi:hypothetical protein
VFAGHVLTLRRGWDTTARPCQLAHSRAWRVTSWRKSTPDAALEWTDAEVF